MIPNLEPVDEIQKIRQQIKELKAREAELRALITSGAVSTDGHFARATLRTQKRKRFDRQAAEAELGDLSRFCVEREVTVLRLTPVENDDVILIEE